MAIFMPDVSTLGDFSDADVIENFASWFAEFEISKVVEVDGDDPESIQSALSLLDGTPPSLIWCEYTYGHSAIFNAASEALIDGDSLNLPGDGFCLRFFVAEIEGDVKTETFPRMGVISGGLFACESCETLTVDDAEGGGCDLCEDSGPTWLTVWDESAREDLIENFENLDLPLPAWLPERKGC